MCATPLELSFFAFDLSLPKDISVLCASLTHLIVSCPSILVPLVPLDRDGKEEIETGYGCIYILHVEQAVRNFPGKIFC